MQITSLYEDTLAKKIALITLILLFLPVLLFSQQNDSIEIGSQKYYGYLRSLFRENRSEELSFWLQKAEKQGKLKKDTNLLINTYHNYARQYYDEQNLEKSIEYLQLAYNLSSSFGDKALLAKSVNLLGTMHSYAGNDSLALNCFKKAEEINNENPNVDMLNSLNVNLAIAYKKTGQYDKALEYLLKSKNNLDTSNIEVYSSYHLNASNIYMEMDSIETALYHATEALLMKTRIKDKRGIARATLAMGLVFAKKDMPKQAIGYFEEAVVLGKEMKEPTLEMEAYEHLYSQYYKLKKYEYALDAYKIFHLIKDSINHSKSQREINELKAVSLLQAKNQNLKKEAESKQQIESNLETQKKVNYILLAFVLTAMFLIGFVVFTFRQKERFAALLTQRNKEYQSMNIKLKESNAAKDKFMSILAHDMINPFNAFLGVTQFLQRSYDELNEDDIKESINDISESAKGLYTLLENLLKWGRSQTGRINFTPDYLNLKMLVCGTISILKNNAQVKEVELKAEIPETLEVFVDPNMITTVIRNIVSNAIKFTPKGGKILVQASNSNSLTTVSVIDTGMGTSESDIKKLFDLSKHHSTLGTSNEKGTGLGLILCKDFVEKHGGKIWVESQKGKGSTFTFTIPDKN